MAKIRRVIRKVESSRGDFFDEHLWPVYIALVVLGGFLMGVSAAYLPLAGVPWYATAWTSLAGIPLAIAAFMVAFRYIDNRLVRRSLQLSVVVCAILHVALVVQMVETKLFGDLMSRRRNQQREIVEPRPPRLVPEYAPSALLPEEDRPRQDFERPLETRTPEPDSRPEEIVRQPTPDEPRSPPEVQPVPVPENVATTEPNVVRRNRPNESAPRQAAEGSRLSRQLQPSEMKISQLIAPPTPAAVPAAGVEARASAAPVERQTAESAIASRAAAEPTTSSPAETPQLARRAEPNTMAPEVSAQPTLRREVAQPSATPRTTMAAADSPSPSRETTPVEIAPATTAAERRTTTSPQIARATSEPVPEISREPAATPQRRNSPAEAQPTAVAATPSPVANRQPRSTARPDVATSAAAVSPTSRDSGETSSALAASAEASRIERASTPVTSARAADLPATEPRSDNAAQPALQAGRAQGREAPAMAADPTAAPTLTRRSGAPSLPAVSLAAESAAGAVASAAASGEVSPASTVTRRQTVESPAVARIEGQPSPSQVASASQIASNPATIRRSATGSAAMDSPVTAAQSGVATISRSTDSAVTNAVTIVGDVPANAGPQVAGAANPGPSSAAISRQSAPVASDATMTQPSLAAAAASPASQLARGGSARAESQSTPAMDSSSSAAGSPRRAVASAESTTSPDAVESPAASVSIAAAAASSAQPGRMALSRGQAGVAGGGASPNVDSSLPGGDSPALAASGAARRAEATQSGPPGAALSPSQASQVARARAGADRPTASLAAETLEAGTTGGSAQLADATASSGAAITQADADAQRGAVTAAKGTGEVDLGPTQTIAEAGSGRAAGGGQPQLNLNTQTPRLARQTSASGAPLMALAAADAGSVAAPAGDAGGAAARSEPSPAAVAPVRTVAGGEATASGGPSRADEAGALAEANTAALLAQSNVSRNDNASGASGGESAAGQPGIEDEEEKARRLARAALGGSPQLALAGPVVADVPATPMGDGGDGGAPGASPEVTPAAVATARASRGGGAPAGGAPLAAGAPEVGGTSGAELAGDVTIARAEASDSALGDPALGGGTASPARAAAGPTFSASTEAETIALAGAPASGGTADGAPVEARGVEASRLAGGAPGAANVGPVGAIAGTEIIDAPATSAPGDGPGRRQASPASDDGPAIGGLTSVGAPGKRGPGTELAAGSTRVAEIPTMGSDSAVTQADLDHTMGGAGNTPMTRQTGEAVAVNIEAPDGPGGLGAEYSPQVGINTRQARQESLNVQLRSARFVKANVGGLPSVSTSAIATADAFSGRGARQAGDQPNGGRGAPAPQTEEAIDRGLAFLARYQAPDGGWSLQGFPEEAQLATDTAATALAVLAFQGAGYNHREHQYKEVVRGGIDFLVKSQKENGDLFVPLDDDSNRSVWLYSHSLAALALCEAYGMTQDPDLKEPAQKALDFIVAGQHAQRGGWRYSPGVGTDTSVTGWMMMALKSGELAGLQVPPDTYQKIDKWLDGAQKSPSEPHLYRYNPFAPDTAEQRHGRSASKTMTAVGLLMRLYTGWRRDNTNLARGADYLKQNLPTIGTPRDPQRDTYYWYYGTQVMFHMGGEHWQTWNSRLHPLLVQSQLPSGPLAGSWDPKGAVPDRWGPHGGRLYVTTLNLLSLEVFYRHLPLYEDTAR
jgi:hypothetical protein